MEKFPISPIKKSLTTTFPPIDNWSGVDKSYEHKSSPCIQMDSQLSRQLEASFPATIVKSDE